MVVKVAVANLVPFSVAPNLEGEGKEELRKQYQEQIDSKTIQDIGEPKEEYSNNKVRTIIPREGEIII